MSSTEFGPVQFGIDTFGDVTADGHGRLLSQAQVIRDIVEEGVLADQVGIDHFGVGEHHRDDFAVSAPEIVLTAVAAQTSAVRLGSAVTVLSSDDPVRVYQRFATLDAVSDGRAEMTVGRGSFTESFPLFGHDLADYGKLFEEKLDLLAALRTEKPVTWRGTVRGALDGVQVYPTTAGGGLPVWVGVGGSPESVLRAARHDMPMMLAIIGGNPARFRPFADLFRRAQAEHAALPLGVHSGGLIADTDAGAREIHYSHYKAGIDRIGRERGWPPLTPERYANDIEHGSLYVGSPTTVAAKLAGAVRTLGAQRFDLKYSAGTLPHAAMMRSIELFGAEVVPRVRELLSKDPPPTP